MTQDENAPDLPEELKFLSHNLAVLCVVGLHAELAADDGGFNCSVFLGMHEQAFETAIMPH